MVPACTCLLVIPVSTALFPLRGIAWLLSWSRCYCSLISCFILKLCPHVPHVAFQFLPLCDFPSFQCFFVPFPHLSFPCLTLPEPHPLVRVCVRMVHAPSCLCQFIPCSPVLPAGVSHSCYLSCLLHSLTVSSHFCFLFLVFSMICTLLLFALCLSSFIATLYFCPFDSLLDFLDSWFLCIIQLFFFKAVS